MTLIGEPASERDVCDRQPPIAEQGLGLARQVTEQRLYQLVRQSGPIADRQFEIEFLDSGVEVFAFTFG